MRNIITTTPWFSGDTKPPKDRIGPYKRDYSLLKNGPYEKWCWWNGYVFGPAAESAKNAKINYDTFGPSLTQNLPWRGVMK